MADSGNAKAVSAHSNNASLPSSQSTASSISKRSSSSKTLASPSKPTSSLNKSTPNSKSTQPVKPSTPKGILKTVSSTSGSPKQKSNLSVDSTTSVHNKQHPVTSVDVKATSVHKQTSGEIVVGKKADRKIGQNVVGVMKSKVQSVEKLAEVVGTNKGSKMDNIVTSSKEYKFDPEKSLVKLLPGCDIEEEIRKLKEAHADIPGEVRMCRGTCTRKDKGGTTVAPGESEDSIFKYDSEILKKPLCDLEPVVSSTGLNLNDNISSGGCPESTVTKKIIKSEKEDPSNSKKPSNNKQMNPSKSLSSLAKSLDGKSSQPIKSSSQKGILKNASSNSGAIQKNIPAEPSSTYLHDKQLTPSIDVKNTFEQKKTSDETLITDKASGKVTQNSVIDDLNCEVYDIERMVEAERLKTLAKAGLSLKEYKFDPEKSIVRLLPGCDVEEEIRKLKEAHADIPGEVRMCRSTCTRKDKGGTTIAPGEDEDSISQYDSEILKIPVGDCKPLLPVKGQTDFHDNLSSSKSGNLSNQINIKQEEEEEEDGYVIVDPKKEIERINATFDKVTDYNVAEKSKNSFSKDSSLVSHISNAAKNDAHCINLISNEEIVEKSLKSESDRIIVDSDSLKKTSIKLLAVASESVVLPGPVGIKFSDNVLVNQNSVSAEVICSLSSNCNNNGFNSVSEVSSNAFNINTACNLATDNVDNANVTNYPMKIDSNDCPAYKDVSDPIPTSVDVKIAYDSGSGVPKMNGECIIKSETSQIPIENPPNSQVSSLENVGSKDKADGPPPEETKHSIRVKVWDLLEQHNYVLFPRPCKGRIPHFVGSPEAADRLATLDDFKNAKNVKVNPDKPQAHVRFLTLEAGKNLFVPIPRLRSGLFKRIVPPAGASKEELKTVVTQQGVLSSGQALGLDDKASIDLVIMGAVAVSKEGHRIGKGEGYADLEYAIMMKMGAITPDTVVITTVHDEQVFDTLPHHLFKEHDVPVDFIVTPTQVYEVKPRLPKPNGIFWNILSNRRLSLIPILKTLREREIGEGNECTLKEVDSDPEDRPVRPFRFFRRMPKRSRREPMKAKNQRSPRESSAPPATPNIRPPQKSRQSRTFRRKPAAARSSSAKEQPIRSVESGNMNRRKPQNMVERVRAGGDGVRPVRRRYFRKPRAPIAFSIRVSGISQGTRVRDLKSALNERGVKPYDITWESNRGHAVLHFSRMEMFKDKKPQLLSEVSSLDVVEGFPAKLELKLPGNARAFKYEWCVNGKPINVAERLKIITRMDGTAALLIKNVNLQDAGEYTVTVRNKQGEVTSTGALNVTAKTKADFPEVAPRFVEEINDVSADKNETLLLSYSIAGNPVPDIEWSKDGTLLSPTDRIQLLCDGNKVGLKINQCRMIDGGEYKCTLKNHLGEAELITNVTVNAPSRGNNQINNLNNKVVSLQDIATAMDDIIASLHDLKVKGEGEEDPKDSLCVEPANSISRIESTGISAV